MKTKACCLLILVCAIGGILWSNWTSRAAETVTTDSAPAAAPATAPVWNEYLLAEIPGLKATARVKSIASFADEDWFEIQITNNGAASNITDLQLRAPAQYGNLAMSNLLAEIPIGVPPAGSRDHTRSSGFVIPAGALNMKEIGEYAANHFSTRTDSFPVTANLTLMLTLRDGRSLQTPRSGVSIAFTWLAPTAADVSLLQKQVAALLAKSVTGPRQANLSYVSQRLSPGENVRLTTLLKMPEISKVVTLDQALAALKQGQADGATPIQELAKLVQSRWPKDPEVIAFFHQQNIVPGEEALADMFAMAFSHWDDSLLEPVVKLIELAAVTSPVRTPPGSPRSIFESPSSTVDQALLILNQHTALWVNDAAITARLSKAVLILYPIANSAASRSPGAPSPGDHAFSYGMKQLALTHDRAMIAVLRPYLADKTVDDFGLHSANMPSGVTPLRVCELAANAISKLLGEPAIYSPGAAAKAPLGGPYPEWDDWDKKNEALAKRLDAMAKP